MKEMRVRTNGHRRLFVYRHDVPVEVLEDDLDWTDENDVDGFFCYRGVWYHLSQFIRLPERAPMLAGWHGYHADSFFSGVVLRTTDDGEAYQVGTFFSL